MILGGIKALFGAACHKIAPYLSLIRLVLAVGALVLVAVGARRVSVWHDAYRHVRATQKALATSEGKRQLCEGDLAASQHAADEAALLAETVAREDRAQAERMEHALQARLNAADDLGHELARRLHDHQARACRPAVPAATGAAPEPDAPVGESGSDGALAAVFGACERDAIRADGWLEWWTAVEATR